MVDLTSEELNQYYLPAELMDNIEENTAKMQDDLKRDPTKFRPFTSHLPQDNYLNNLTEELNHAIFASIRHHQMLIEFSAMMEDFFSVFVLLKSFQSTFQICNLVFTFLMVSTQHKYDEIAYFYSLKICLDRRNRALYQFDALLDPNAIGCVSIVLFWRDIVATIISHWRCIDALPMVFMWWPISAHYVNYSCQF